MLAVGQWRKAKYVVLTNVGGSATLGTGSIDKVQKLLDDGLPETLDSQCYWRADVDARVDNNFDVKWSYPQILSVADFLPEVIGHGGTRNKARAQAIKAFVSEQYELDFEVRSV